MSSTESFPENWREQFQDWSARNLSKLQAMGRLVGWESVRRGMKREDDLKFRDSLAYHNKLHGEKVAVEDAEEEDMGDMILGDRIEKHYHGQSSNGIGTLGKLAIGSALMASGAGMGAGIPMLLSALMDKPTVQSPPATEDTDTLFDLRLGGPGKTE